MTTKGETPRGLAAEGNPCKQSIRWRIPSMTRVFLVTDPPGLAFIGRLAPTRFTCSPPAMVDGRVFVRAPCGIVCYDLRRGASTVSSE